MTELTDTHESCTGRPFGRFDHVVIICSPEDIGSVMSSHVLTSGEFEIRPVCGFMRDTSVSFDIKKKFSGNSDEFHVVVENYIAISVAYNMGKKSVLVINYRDGFFSDMQKIRNVSLGIPDGYDIAVFNPIVKNCGSGEEWSRFEFGTHYGIYALSQNAMKKAVDIFDSACIGGNKGVLHKISSSISTRWFWEKCNAYACNVWDDADMANEDSSIGSFRTKLLSYERRIPLVSMRSVFERRAISDGVCRSCDDMWGRFKFRAACLYTGNVERYTMLRRELSRVGLHGVLPMWQTRTKLDDYLRTGKRGHGASIGFFNSGLGHYRAIRTAYDSGAKNALIIEDDVRFLENISLLRDIINDLPHDYDLALFDWFSAIPAGSYSSKYWQRFAKARSVACYAISRNAMLRLMRIWEIALRRTGIKTIDGYLHERCFRGCNLYYSFPHAAIQRKINRANSGNPEKFYVRWNYPAGMYAQ